MQMWAWEIAFHSLAGSVGSIRKRIDIYIDEVADGFERILLKFPKIVNVLFDYLLFGVMQMLLTM